MSGPERRGPRSRSAAASALRLAVLAALALPAAAAAQAPAAPPGVGDELSCEVRVFPATQRVRNDHVLQIGWLCNGREPGDDLRIDVVRAPQHGTFVERSDEDDGNIRLSYRPSPGYAGSDEFSVRILTGRGRASATMSFPVEVYDVSADQEPMCSAADIVIEPGATAEWSGLCTDPDEDPLVYRIYALPEHGTLRLEEPDRIIYTAEPGFSGRDSFVYAVSDGVVALAQMVSVEIAATTSEPEPEIPVPEPTDAPPDVPTPTPDRAPPGLTVARGVELGEATAFLPRAWASAPVRIGRSAVRVMVIRCDEACRVRAQLRLRRKGGRPIPLGEDILDLAAHRRGPVRVAIPPATRAAVRHARDLRLELRLEARYAGGLVRRDTLRLPVKITG